ncbi:MAG TPA: FKBP-type peptidyl-prolyl cis-trans isomerase, partial [Myxococcales bacterium LLY-WYZ-16_1]|nr:FKBP-type peptidyl-prolyl cis-trans isomerase [Myxococcales bacterium LLY-WYZ-16_1]
GRRVRMAFELKLADGTPVDAATAGEPLEWTVGDGTLDHGLESLLEGLAPGERVTFDVPPGQAFGEHDPANVHELPLGDFPEGLAPREGAVFRFATPGGQEIPGTVVEVGEAAARVDFNHPLAGRRFRLRVEILAVAGESPV